MPTSSDQVVDSDNIFIVGVAVVILHTHLCISCRCMLNKTKDQLNSVWFMLFSRGYYNAEIILKHFSVQGNSETKTRWNSFETVPKGTETQVTNRRVYLFYRNLFPYLKLSFICDCYIPIQTPMLTLFRTQCHIMFMISNEIGISVPALPERLPY